MVDKFFCNIYRKFTSIGFFKKQKKTKIGREIEKIGPKKSPVVIFIHGLSGSPELSWSSMIDLCKKDPSLNQYSFDFYTYPTKKFFFFFKERVPRLRELAKGLATEIRLRHRNRESVILICHSMGGLVARQYLVDCAKNNIPNYIDRALLLATPNSGATIAALATKVFPSNQQLKLLAPFSEEITKLNDDWVKLLLEDSTRIKYVAGGADMIVSEPSAKGVVGRELDDMLIGYNHESIIIGKNHNDSNYLLIRDFIIGPNRKQQELFTQSSSPGDPLFEIYKPQDEEFYIVRSSDASILRATEGGHVWVTGPSGLGKTASLQRRAMLSGVRIIHIFLSGVTNPTPENLIWNICIEIADVVDSELILQKEASISECVKFLRRVIRKHEINENWAILIEEIPISLGEMYEKFIELLEIILFGLEAEEAHHVKLLFSSIVDVSNAMPCRAVKFRTRVQIIPFKKWTQTETKKLVEMLSKTTGFYSDFEEQAMILEEASGSPRFIKSIFRRCRNGTAENLSLKELLDVVKAEQV